MIKRQGRDLVVIAPLPEELHAVRYAFGSPTTPVKSSPFPHFEGELVLASGDVIQCAIFSQHAVGRAHAAALATYIFVNLKAKLILVCGLCGGLQRAGPRDSIRLGDVIFADRIVDAEIRKLAFGGYQMQTDPWSASSDYRSIASQLQTTFEFRRFLAPDDTTDAWYRSTNFSMHTGTIVSVSSVIADAEMSRTLRTKAAAAGGVDPPIAVEMEGNGILTSARIFGVQGAVVMIRSVNDFADETKPDTEKHIRRTACENAAFVSMAFARSYFDGRT